MKKGKEIFTIVAILIFVFGIGLFVALNGIKAHNNHYVRIEVNPKIEFITDAYNNVITYTPINEEAKILVCQENFIGMKVQDASLKFVELCAMANYIDVEGEDNAVRITAISGLTHSLENKIFKKINDYFKNHNIKSVIVESENDIDLISEAQDKNIASSNKLMLINSILEKDSSLTEKELNKLNETKLIDKLIKIHKSINYSPSTYTTEQLTNKTKLIDFNRTKYDTHMFELNNESISKFSEEFEEYKNTHTNSYEENFNQAYKNWRSSLYN